MLVSLNKPVDSRDSQLPKTISFSSSELDLSAAKALTASVSKDRTLLDFDDLLFVCNGAGPVFLRPASLFRDRGLSGLWSDESLELFCF